MEEYKFNIYRLDFGLLRPSRADNFEVNGNWYSIGKRRNIKQSSNLQMKVKDLARALIEEGLIFNEEFQIRIELK